MRCLVLIEHMQSAEIDVDALSCAENYWAYIPVVMHIRQAWKHVLKLQLCM